MLFVNAAEVKAVLSVEDSYRAVTSAYRAYGKERRVTSNPSASYVIVPNAAPTMVWLKGANLSELGAAGVFFGAQFGDYYFAVLDGQTGTMRGMIEQAWLTKRRTAVTACVTAQYLARPGAKIAALIGAGQIGEEVVRCLPHGFALSDFRVASRTLEGAESFVRRLAPVVTAALRAVASAEEAARDADIVITITLASQPIIQPGWLKQGSVLISMGGVPEIDFGVLGEIDRVFIDDVDYAMLRGDIANWIANGHIDHESMLQRINADMGEVVYGSKSGRTDDSQRILAIVQGMAVCDLALADHIIATARKEGRGQEVNVTRQMEVPTTLTHRPRSEFIAAGLDQRRPRSV